MADGQVTVRATSVSNPDVFGECIVTISGQSDSEKPEEDDGKHESGGGKDELQKPAPEQKPEDGAETDQQSEAEGGKDQTTVPETADPFPVTAGIVVCLAAAGILLTSRKILK